MNIACDGIEPVDVLPLPLRLKKSAAHRQYLRDGVNDRLPVRRGFFINQRERYGLASPTFRARAAPECSATPSPVFFSASEVAQDRAI